MTERVRFELDVDDIPAAWFNIIPSMAQAGMPPLPPIHPATHEPIGPEALAPLFPESLIMQEVSAEPWIDVPGPVLDIYRLWRPTPLIQTR
jgi:tryptophan synthase beta chain